MSYYDEEKNLPAAYSQDGEDYKEENTEDTYDTEREKDTLDESEDVYELPASRSDRNRIWSILSVILGAVAIILAPIVWYVSLILSVPALAFALLSRKHFEFYTPMTLTGLFVSMIAIVCGISFMLAGVLGLI